MPTMRLFTCFLQLLTGLALPAVPPSSGPCLLGTFHRKVAGFSDSMEESQEYIYPKDLVVPFQEVWSRSYCRPVETLVDIVSEYPSEVEHLFSPSCVSLLRCTGCCSDEQLHCVSLETANITMQLVKYRALDSPFFVEMSFSQHVRCDCRPWWEKRKPKRRRPKGRGPRKREEQKHKDCHLCGGTVCRR